MEHPEVKPIFRAEVVEAINQPRITREYYTKYEWTKLLGVRARQLASGAKPLVSLDGLKTSDPRFLEKVALREIEQRKLPFFVRRPLPTGQSEYWSTQELEMMW